MKPFGAIGLVAVSFLLAAPVRTLAQEGHQEEGAKPAQHEEQAKPQKQQQEAKPPKQEQAKPERQQAQAQPQKQEQHAKTQEENQQKNNQQQARNKQQQDTQHKQQQVKAQQNEEKSQQHQQQANAHAQESQHQYAHNGQKDRYGHVYNESHFGPSHNTRFVQNGGRYYNGRREYSYGGYWFYAGVYPPWFYQQNVYFIMGADGLWYAVAADNPSLTFEVNIG